MSRSTEEYLIHRYDPRPNGECECGFCKGVRVIRSREHDDAPDARAGGAE